MSRESGVESRKVIVRAIHACPVQFPAFAGLSLRRQGDMPTSWGIAPTI